MRVRAHRASTMMQLLLLKPVTRNAHCTQGLALWLRRAPVTSWGLLPATFCHLHGGPNIPQLLVTGQAEPPDSALPQHT